MENWTWLHAAHADAAASGLTAKILTLAQKYIPKRILFEKKSTHPWVNGRVLHLVQRKKEAEGTVNENEVRDQCSKGILEEYGKYVQRERAQLQKQRSGYKSWWSMSRRLLQKKGQVSSIPALKNSAGQWVLDNKAKADLFATTFSSKFIMSAAEHNEYTDLEPRPYKGQCYIARVTEEQAMGVLNSLDVDSGTWPDLLPARILKVCANVLAKPVHLLALCIISSGFWPTDWIHHWIVPLHKKKNKYSPANYRGIHLTSQLSKVVERLLKALVDPYIVRTSAFGPQQFAYTVGRGARDVLAMLVLVWIKALAEGQKIAVYCSDVSGAFDRVRMTRLIAKLRNKGLHHSLVDVISSWLRQRTSQVVVGGTYSDEMLLFNMVFQGTVIGPMLWNLYFEDARHAINEWHFKEVVFADDLNAYRVFSSNTDNHSIDTAITNCQQELHKWGRANQVCFDESKESRHVLSSTESVGGTFKQLGITFNGGLTMSETVADLVCAAGWKLRTLLRTKRYYTDADLINLYKAHMLSWIEYRTAAIYHATRAVLCNLDAVQSRFLRKVGVDEITALMEFNLAPLELRRDIAMLGLLHRAAIREGPPQLQTMFKRRVGSSLLHDPYEHRRPPLVRRSAWGVIPIYNRLGSDARNIATVKDFQFYLIERVRTIVRKGLVEDWKRVYSPR
jgi:hypothetical protein